MSCKQVQQEILDRLAAGEATLPAGLETHRKSCAACQSYYRRQSQMFCSIDQGLSVIANAPVPPSLLAGVRGRLDERAARHSFRFHGWSVATLAGAALAALLFALLWHRSIRPGEPVLEVARVTAPRTVEPERGVPVMAEVPGPAKPASHPARRVVSAKARVLDSQKEQAAEVIVLAEEREAFVRFIEQVPKNPAAALALTRPRPEMDESPVEIALLTIKPVEVKPLEAAEE